MKRRIDLAQLKELTLEQQAKLREWWNPQEYDVIAEKYVHLGETEYNAYVIHDISGRIYVDCDVYEWVKKENCLPFLDIAQMIELLLYIEPRHSFDIDFAKCEFTEKDKICDRLWEAVKEIL